MATHAEGLAIASASSGWLARHFGTARYDEIRAHVAAILSGEEEPPPDLLAWARAVVECEAERSKKSSAPLAADKPAYHHATPAVQIGKHEWRVVVLDFWLDPSERCTQYQWRACGETCWRPAREWPTYDGDDGQFGGLPRTLGPKLYQPHKADIDAALAGTPIPANPQFDLFGGGAGPDKG